MITEKTTKKLQEMLEILDVELFHQKFPMKHEEIEENWKRILKLEKHIKWELGNIESEMEYQIEKRRDADQVVQLNVWQENWKY